MVTYFSSLQYVQVGQWEKKEMRFNETQASLDIVAVAVYSDGAVMKVAVLKVTKVLLRQDVLWPIRLRR